MGQLLKGESGVSTRVAWGQPPLAQHVVVGWQLLEQESLALLGQLVKAEKLAAEN